MENQVKIFLNSFEIPIKFKIVSFFLLLLSIQTHDASESI